VTLFLAGNPARRDDENFGVKPNHHRILPDQAANPEPPTGRIIHFKLSTG
jgi:hypothetical protein